MLFLFPAKCKRDCILYKSMDETTATSEQPSGMKTFALILIGLVALRTLLGFVYFPPMVALWDMMLVFTSIGTVNQVMQKAPQVFTNVALNVPQVHSKAENLPKGHKLQALGYAGPADFVFLAMFFVALFKFNMRTRQTLIW